jgi:hypothetical protein
MRGGGGGYLKAWGAINHFEIPLTGIKAHILRHNPKKRYPYPAL